LALGHLELHALTLSQAAEAVSLNGGVVDERHPRATSAFDISSKRSVGGDDVRLVACGLA